MLGFQDKWILTLSIISWQNDPREDNFFNKVQQVGTGVGVCATGASVCISVCVCVSVC